jgi:hypothetical protein
MPYAPPPVVTSLSAIPLATTSSSSPPKITFGSSKGLALNYQAAFGIFSSSQLKSTTTTNTALSPVTSQKSSTIEEKRSQPVDMQRQQAVKELKDILSTSPVSCSPRRKSSPQVYTRRFHLKVDLPSVPEPPIETPRKKSGEFVKPSLKKGSKSEPATPTCPKFVHFDTDLEQVRWFLEAEKPRAVSCEASDEESDEEFSESSDEEDELIITLPNFPRITTLHSSKSVFVERIFLSDNKRQLRGRIQVQNIAFHKTVTVRYTFDFWQSVSEISASYIEVGQDRKNKNLDTFVFSIDLIDNSRNSINGQTMYFAVQYTVGDRVYWDNNNGSNYQVNFKRLTQQPPPQKSKRKPKSKTYSKWSYSGRKSVNDERKRVDSDELGRSPPSLAVSPKSLHVSSQQKKQTNRYDINLSLSAAMTKTTPQPGDNSSSDDDDSSSSSNSSSRSVASSLRQHPIVPTSSQMHLNHHIPPYSSYFPTAITYSNENFSSYFPSNCVDGMPGTMDSSCEELSRLAKASLEVSRSSTTPIAIPKPTMSYFELVDRYCFYQGSHSPPVSTK